MNCRETSRMVAEGTFDDGPLWLRFLALAHLAICRYCRRYRAQLRLIASATRRWSAGISERRPDV